MMEHSLHYIITARHLTDVVKTAMWVVPDAVDLKQYLFSLGLFLHAYISGNPLELTVYLLAWETRLVRCP